MVELYINHDDFQKIPAGRIKLSINIEEDGLDNICMIYFFIVESFPSHRQRSPTFVVGLLNNCIVELYRVYGRFVLTLVLMVF